MDSEVEQIECISKEDYSYCKIKWTIPRSILQPYGVKEGSSIKFSFKLKFLNSSWQLKLEKGGGDPTYIPIKLYLNEADVEEDCIWAHCETIVNKNTDEDEFYIFGHE